MGSNLRVWYTIYIYTLARDTGFHCTAHVLCIFMFYKYVACTQ